MIYVKSLGECVTCHKHRINYNSFKSVHLQLPHYVVPVQSMLYVCLFPSTGYNSLTTDCSVGKTKALHWLYFASLTIFLWLFDAVCILIFSFITQSFLYCLMILARHILKYEFVFAWMFLFLESLTKCHLSWAPEVSHCFIFIYLFFLWCFPLVESHLHIFLSVLNMYLHQQSMYSESAKASLFCSVQYCPCSAYNSVLHMVNPLSIFIQ